MLLAVTAVMLVFLYNSLVFNSFNPSLARSRLTHLASWKMIPSAVREPRVTVLTPWRMPTL